MVALTAIIILGGIAVLALAAWPLLSGLRNTNITNMQSPAPSLGPHHWNTPLQPNAYGPGYADDGW